MTKFHDYSQLKDVVDSLHDRAFDDDSVTFDTTYENTLEIRFIVKTAENRLVIDEQGREKTGL